jgi:hypothetical protein
LAVLDFRRNSVARIEQDRKQRHRLLMLILMLGVVLILIDAVGVSQNWRWLDSLLFPLREPPVRGSIDNRLDMLVRDESLPGTIRLSNGPPPAKPADAEGYFPGVTAADFAGVRDDTPSTHADQAGSLHLLEILSKHDEKTLREASVGYITYAQLLRQPNHYRGRLATVSGIARRVNRIDLPKNDYGIADYYQVWLFPTDNPISPMVVYCLQLPEGFPTGMELSQEAEVTGFFFKLWAYESKDALRVAPTLLAKTLQWNKRPVMEPEPPGDKRMTPLTVCVAAALAMLLAWFVYFRTRSGRPASPDRPPDFKSLENWDRKK